ncbi:MAG TPA: diguanylate cyclase response regulator [Rickettsiales bacterium]|nr:diguanylate cyclase response regulator [Rickettsiales bacterium]
MHVDKLTDKLKVLLIEDSKGDAVLIERSLKRALPEIAKIAKASYLGEALDILAAQDFDVALLDRSLPDTEEFDGLKSLQNMAPQLPIIFLTAYKDEKSALEAIENGAQDYLFKDSMDGHSIKRAIQYALMRKKFESVLITRANFDALTGLANRTLFESRLDMALARMKRHGGYVAVMFLDLDGFKQVNDRLGHAVGDLLLREVGRRIASGLREYDTAARFGGDEFAVLLENLPHPEHSETVAQKIIAQIDKPFSLSGSAVDIGISIGIAVCDKTHLQKGRSLIAQADSAMYEAKAEAGSAWRVYSGEARARIKKAT